MQDRQSDALTKYYEKCARDRRRCRRSLILKLVLIYGAIFGLIAWIISRGL